MMQTLHIHQHLWACQQLCREFGYNKIPLHPPGQRIVVHIWPEDRTSWRLRGEGEWYVRPTLEYYRCHQVYIPKPKQHTLSLQWNPTCMG